MQNNTQGCNVFRLMWIFRNNPIKLSISTVRKSIFIRNQIATETRIRNDYKAKHGATAPPRSLLSLYLDEILDAKEDRKFPKFSGRSIVKLTG